jgi:hypothetical protein
MMVIHWQIRVQEIIDDGMRESGRIPRTLECELTNDLVDSCVPGDIAVVAGEVKVASVEDGVSKAKKKDQTLFLLYLHANSITGPRTKIAEEGDGAAGDKPDGSTPHLPTLLHFQQCGQISVILDLPAGAHAVCVCCLCATLQATRAAT